MKGARMPGTRMLSERQLRRIEKLPRGYRVVKTRDGVVILRRADGRLVRMQPDGRMIPGISVERVQDYLHVHG
jgi:hypothetical protein